MKSRQKRCFLHKVCEFLVSVLFRYLQICLAEVECYNEYFHMTKRILSLRSKILGLGSCFLGPGSSGLRSWFYAAGPGLLILVRSVLITKCAKKLLRSVTGITKFGSYQKCDKKYYKVLQKIFEKCEIYFKVRREVLTKCDRGYKV